MEWIERLNDALSYIENHLTEETDLEQLGRIACCSSYHFQRMFSYMAGIPLSEYIRRRKMSLAAVDLQGRGMKIIDVPDLQFSHSIQPGFPVRPLYRSVLPEKGRGLHKILSANYL